MARAHIPFSISDYSDNYTARELRALADEQAAILNNDIKVVDISEAAEVLTMVYDYEGVSTVTRRFVIVCRSEHAPETRQGGIVYRRFTT